MSFPFYLQPDAKDCGPACLRMVVKFYGKNIETEKLRSLAEIGKDGVTIFGIAQAAESIGFNTEALQLDIGELMQIQLPAIVHWKQKHFVVLYKISRHRIFIADPAIGKLKLAVKDFEQNWYSTGNTNATRTGIALLLKPTEIFHQLTSDATPTHTDWNQMWQYAIPHKRRFTGLIICLVIGMAFQYIFPYLTQGVVDKGIQQKNIGLIKLLLIGQFFLLLTQVGVDFIRSRLLLSISTKINVSIVTGFWKKLLKLPLYFFDSKLVGDILQRVNDHRRIESFITGTALQTIFSMVNLVVFSIILLRYNFFVFTVFAVGSALYLFWIYYFLRYRRQLDYNRFTVSAKENSAVLQLIYGIHEIKLNNAEQIKRGEWEKLQQQLFTLNFKSLSLNQIEQAGGILLTQGKNILITYLVATAVVKGNLTIGMMLAIQYIIGQLNSPIDQFINFTQQAQDARISIERMNEVHDMEEEEPENDFFTKDIGKNYSIRFKNVSFTYKGAGNLPALKNINCYFESGKTTAIVGTSGSGKTTLLKLLQKLHLDYTGEISIGNNNMLQISPFYWRSICGSVMQEGYIFSDSIAKNIAVKDKEPDLEKIKIACTLANISNFIEALPLGFDTKIGAEGSGLSTGQKQRILIARAIYKEPLFLFFDEATNALDANTEKAILKICNTFS